MHNSVSVLQMLRFSAGEHLLLHSEPSEYTNNGSEEEEGRIQAYSVITVRPCWTCNL